MFFFNVATGKPEIMYVAPMTFVVDNAAPETRAAVLTDLHRRAEPHFPRAQPAQVTGGVWGGGHALHCTWGFVFSFFLITHNCCPSLASPKFLDEKTETEFYSCLFIPKPISFPMHNVVEYFNG